MLLLLVSFAWETPHMSISLIESEHRSQRSLGGTFVSIALHASLITLAVYATASAGVVSVSTDSGYADQVLSSAPDGPDAKTEYGRALGEFIRNGTAAPTGVPAHQDL